MTVFIITIMLSSVTIQTWSQSVMKSPRFLRNLADSPAGSRFTISQGGQKQKTDAKDVGKRNLMPDLKGSQGVFCFSFLRLDPIHPGSGAAFSYSLQKSIQCHRFPLSVDFHGFVRPVPHPTRDAPFSGDFSGVITEPDSLNMPMNEDVFPKHLPSPLSIEILFSP